MSVLNDRPIETIWQKYRQLVMPATASAVQVEETHKAFFAGAAALFELVMKIMDSDREPTANDLRNMDKVAGELRRFGQALDAETLQRNSRRPS